MTYEYMLERVEDRTGLRSSEEAGRAMDATLFVLGSHLSASERAWLAERLPAPLSTALLDASYQGPVELDIFYREVAERDGVPVPFAAEHAQVVCQVIGETLTPDARRHLELQFPEQMRWMFERRARHEAPSPPHHDVAPGSGRTLATGRPGSEHPISEATRSGPRVPSTHRSS